MQTGNNNQNNGRAVDYASPDTEPGGAAKHDPYAALRYRDFQLYSLGWLFSTIAYQMQSAAIGWEIYRWTGSSLKLGLAGGVQAIPLLLLALPAGQVADRLDRKLIAIVTAALTTVCFLGLAALSVLVDRNTIGVSSALPMLYGLVFTNAAISTFARPARAALLPQIVPARVFSNAVTWNSTIFETSSMAGPALAGLVIAWGSPVRVYAMSAAFTGVFLVFLSLLRNRPTQPPRAREKGELLAGLRFVWQTRIILATITLDLFAVLLGGATYLLPAFARQLDVGAIGFGLLRAAPAMGAISMAVMLAHQPPLRRAGRAMLLAVAGFGVATVVFGMSKWFALSMVALYVTGALDNISVVVRHTLVQLLTPDSMRGRVSAVNAVFIGASNELGGLESGLTAHWWGPVKSVVFGGFGTILVVTLVAMVFPQVWQYGSLADARPAEEGGSEGEGKEGKQEARGQGAGVG